MSAGSPAVKKFYEIVSVVSEGGRFSIQLDGRTARTAKRNVLSAPTQALAEAVAEEWESQIEQIRFETMPLTRLLAAAVDGGAASASEWRNEVIKYLGSDLVCYRAEGPGGLVVRQAKAWDPYVHWLKEEFGAALAVTNGVVFADQPPNVIDCVDNSLQHESPETLMALRTATSISGSAVMALALWKHAFEPEDIFEASRVDERFQEEKWGVDEEAKAREEGMKTEFLAAAHFLSLL